MAFLDGAAAQALLPHGAPAAPPQLLIGLDFGGSPSACLSGCAAAPLVRAFLLSAWAAIQRRRLAVTFALDNGIAGWYADLDAQCAAPGGCSAEDAALAAMPWQSQHGAAAWAGGTGARGTIMNEDYSTFQDKIKGILEM